MPTKELERMRISDADELADFLSTPQVSQVANLIITQEAQKFNLPPQEYFEKYGSQAYVLNQLFKIVTQSGVDIDDKVKSEFKMYLRDVALEEFRNKYPLVDVPNDPDKMYKFTHLYQPLFANSTLQTLFNKGIGMIVGGDYGAGVKDLMEALNPNSQLFKYMYEEGEQYYNRASKAGEFSLWDKLTHFFVSKLRLITFDPLSNLAFAFPFTKGGATAIKYIDTRLGGFISAFGLDKLIPSTISKLMASTTSGVLWGATFYGLEKTDETLSKVIVKELPRRETDLKDFLIGGGILGFSAGVLDSVVGSLFKRLGKDATKKIFPPEVVQTLETAYDNVIGKEIVPLGELENLQAVVTLTNKRLDNLVNRFKGTILESEIETLNTVFKNMASIEDRYRLATYVEKIDNILIKISPQDAIGMIKVNEAVKLVTSDIDLNTTAIVPVRTITPTPPTENVVEVIKKQPKYPHELPLIVKDTQANKLLSIVDNDNVMKDFNKNNPYKIFLTESDDKINIVYTKLEDFDIANPSPIMIQWKNKLLKGYYLDTLPEEMVGFWNDYLKLHFKLSEKSHNLFEPITLLQLTSTHKIPITEITKMVDAINKIYKHTFSPIAHKDIVQLFTNILTNAGLPKELIEQFIANYKVNDIMSLHFLKEIYPKYLIQKFTKPSQPIKYMQKTFKFFATAPLVTAGMIYDDLDLVKIRNFFNKKEILSEVITNDDIAKDIDNPDNILEAINWYSFNEDYGYRLGKEFYKWLSE
jgi:hypothetical protein